MYIHVNGKCWDEPCMLDVKGFHYLACKTSTLNENSSKCVKSGNDNNNISNNNNNNVSKIFGKLQKVSFCTSLHPVSVIDDPHTRFGFRLSSFCLNCFKTRPFIFQLQPRPNEMKWCKICMFNCEDKSTAVTGIFIVENNTCTEYKRVERLIDIVNMKGFAGILNLLYDSDIFLVLLCFLFCNFVYFFFFCNCMNFV